MQVEGMSRAWGAGFLIINGLNLLPFAFLDGGRLVTTLFSTRSGVLEASISIVPGIGVALYAFIAKDWLLLLVCYVAVGSGIRQLTVARAANKLEGELPLRIEDCSDEQLRMVYGAIDGNLRPAAAAETMRELHARKHNQRPSPLARAAILTGYVSSAALVCVAWFWR
jgi:membrane-associated protease RseP (regulator of RpoE activity)